jgi:hypothetical protein
LSTTPTILRAVSTLPPATGAGGRELTIEPTGASTLTTLQKPWLTGISGSTTAFTANVAAATVTPQIAFSGSGAR